MDILVGNISSKESFGDCSLESFLNVSSLPRQELLGSFLLDVTLRTLGVSGLEYFSSPTLIISIPISGIESEEKLGQTVVNSISSIFGIESNETTGRTVVDSISSISGIESNETLDQTTFNSIISISGIESEEMLDNGVLMNNIAFEQDLIWRINKKFTYDLDLGWSVGQGVLRWYRVQGCCKFPTKSGSGLSTGSQIAGGCDVIGLETDDAKCVGALGGQQFVQNILATGVADVCNQLKSGSLRWQVCSMKVFSRPASNFIDPDPNCNTLTEIPFSGYPECLEISLDSDSLIKTIMSVKIHDTIFIENGSGVSVTGGSAVITGNTENLSTYEYVSIINPVLTGGEAFISSSWEQDFLISTKLSFSIIKIDALFSNKETISSIVPINDTVATLCGTCTAMPSSLYAFQNFSRSIILSRFLDRNSIDFPFYFPMYYSKVLKSWKSNYQISGVGDLGKENWSFVFSWLCLDQKFEEQSDPYWKFSMFINKHIASKNIDFNTNISITFPPKDLCLSINNLYFDFSFDLNTLTQYVRNDFTTVTDYVIMSDNIGLFKDAEWKSNPWLNLRLSRNTSRPLLQTLELSPIIP